MVTIFGCVGAASKRVLMISKDCLNAVGVLPVTTGFTTGGAGRLQSASGRRARTVVPIDHGVRKIGDGIVRLCASPERKIFLTAPDVIGKREGIVVQGAVMHPSVAGKAVEREVAAEFGPAGRRFGAGQIRLAPDDCIDM